MYTINIKPMSVNEAWCGKRFKTPAYKIYEQELLWKLPKIIVPKGKIEAHYKIGLSSLNADLGNVEKQLSDILSKRYDFNDKNIYKFIIERFDVSKGNEFIDFDIIPYKI